MTTTPEDSPRPSILDLAENAIDEANTRINRLEPRLRRFARALHDLGVSAIVGSQWASVSERADGFTFHELSPRAFDFLVRALEDLAEGRPVVLPAPGDNQLSFDLTAVASPAYRPAAESTVHVAVPR